jgi:hypothetical protein
MEFCDFGHKPLERLGKMCASDSRKRGEGAEPHSGEAGEGHQRRRSCNCAEVAQVRVSAERELALAGPRELYLSGPGQMTLNRHNVEKLTRSLYPGRSIPAAWGFFAGTMFWARPDFFRPLVEGAGRTFSFENDNTTSDGQLAHAWERVLGIHATLSGKRIGLTKIAGAHPLDGGIEITPAPGQSTKESLVCILKEHALRLSGDLPLGQKLQPQPRAPIAPRVFCIDRLQARVVRASPLFDGRWYLERYPDVDAAGVDPALHYIRHGAAELRDPGPRFDTGWYLAHYPDVARSGMNPLVHFLRRGANEGRHA